MMLVYRNNHLLTITFSINENSSAN